MFLLCCCFCFSLIVFKGLSVRYFSVLFSNLCICIFAKSAHSPVCVFKIPFQSSESPKYGLTPLHSFLAVKLVSLTTHVKGLKPESQITHCLLFLFSFLFFFSSITNICCFPVPGGSLLPGYIVFPSSTWPSPWKTTDRGQGKALVEGYILQWMGKA